LFVNALLPFILDEIAQPTKSVALLL